MSLKHTILGFLKKRPKTGYDLQKKIELTISHFWPSTQSQIYRTLNDMAEQGLIDCELQYQQEKPNKKVYSITGQGSDELVNWLEMPLDVPGHRNQFLVQLFFSKYTTRETAIANLRHYQKQLQERLSFLQTEETEKITRLGESDYERQLYHIIHRNGVLVLQSEIAWAEESIEYLEGYKNERNQNM